MLDYQSVDASLGTLADFDALAEAYHARGMRVMLDLVINHTSNEHPWFQSAVQSLTVEPCADESCLSGTPCRAHNPYVSYYHFKPMEQASKNWQALGNGWATSACSADICRISHWRTKPFAGKLKTPLISGLRTARTISGSTP